MDEFLLDMADPHGSACIAGIGHGEFVLGGPPDDVAQRRIGGNAAPEAYRPTCLVLGQFADELNFHNARFMFGRRRRGGRRERRDQRQSQRDRCVNLQESTDFRALQIAVTGQRPTLVKQDDGVPAGDGHDATDPFFYLKLAVSVHAGFLVLKAH